MSTVKISELIESQTINDETKFEISTTVNGALVSRSVKFGTIKNALDGAGVTSFNGRAGAVDPEAGDYSADQISYDSASVKDELERLESEKVDKEAGKGLSANDFSDDDKQKLDGIEEEANKTEVVQGTGDSTTAVMSQEATTNALAAKVDKETGKGLIEPAPVDGKQYARKDAAWVEVTGDVEEAPIDGKIYGRKDSVWVDVTANIDGQVAAAENAANRAETAADVAMAAGRVYESSAAGQADVNLSEGDYFFVVSADINEMLELWQKGASSPTDTGKRTFNAGAVLKTQNQSWSV